MTDAEHDRITHVPWRDYTHRSGTPQKVSLAEIDPVLEGEGVEARRLRLVEGDFLESQQSASTVFVGLGGVARFRVAEAQFDVGHRDVLTVPGGTAFSAVSVGTEPAVLVAVSSTLPTSEVSESTPDAHLLAWAEYRRKFRSSIMPHAEKFGHHRLSGPHTPLRSVLGHPVRMPPNQASPWHEIPRDLLFVQLDGEIDFSAAGGTTLLRPFDLLMVRAGTPYSYANFGFTDAVFFDVGGRIPVPGATSTYYEEDSGWPVRADAASYKIVSDDPAFRAIYGT